MKTTKLTKIAIVTVSVIAVVILASYVMGESHFHSNRDQSVTVQNGQLIFSLQNDEIMTTFINADIIDQGDVIGSISGPVDRQGVIQTAQDLNSVPSTAYFRLTKTTITDSANGSQTVDWTRLTEEL